MYELPKDRHGCLTAYLVYMVLANSLYTLYFLTEANFPQGTPGWAVPVLVVTGLVNVVCAIALFRWKKWGFWGFCISSAYSLLVNLNLGIGSAQSLIGLIGILVLYAVLHIGGESNKAWPQLE